MGKEIDKILQVSTETESLEDHLDESRVLRDAIDTLDREISMIDVKPFSHNIIGLALGNVAQTYSDAVANELIEDYDLEDYGWSKVIEDDTGRIE